MSGFADRRDVAVIGGGPAGLMAAEQLAGAGHAVTVFDQKRSVGRKFLLAGRAGLNITHSEPLEELIERYGDETQQLAAALRAFGPDDLRRWCAELGHETFVGSSGRVFPEAFRATPLLRSWLARLGESGVNFQVDHRWLGWTGDGQHRFINDGIERVVATAATVFAFGGASWPRVGSDGAWQKPFTGAGIAVAPLAPANCGVRVDWSAVMKERFQGHPIKNVAVSSGGAAVRGDIVVTEAGLEGGPIYAQSRALRAALAHGEVPKVVVDLMPDLTVAKLKKRLGIRRPKSTETRWLAGAGLSPAAIALIRESRNNKIPSDPFLAAQLAKSASFSMRSIESLGSIDRAISTAGGVRFDQLDESFMLVDRPGTFVAGEMLDWEAPTGGYLLQACFSTGFAAGRAAAHWLVGD